MKSSSRRRILQATAATAALGSFPQAIQRALAIPANNATGTIQDVEHVIILMQENRSFDHYFGTLPGVRGFSDRLTIPTASGRPIWSQQGSQSLVQPFHLDATKGNAYHVGGAHDWRDQQAAWDGGRMVAWPKAKATNIAMGYLKQSDIPFHWSLANAFTICDAYHTSISTGTFINRVFLWSGTNGANVTGQACVTNAGWGTLGASADGLTWTTYPERLQAAGVSWKVYRKPGTTDNAQLVAFAAYRAANERLRGFGSPNAPYSPEMEARSPLYKGFGNTMPDGGYLKALQEDIAANRLPQVSWVVAPNSDNEHPSASIPGRGALYIQTLLDMLTAKPEIWSKTVLIINYDENDGFFDHMPPPAPPWRNADGSHEGSSTADIRNEYYTMSAPPGDSAKFPPDGKPFGAGPRVPALIISPWSTGGWVNSQIFDHTSTLRFLEQRFGVQEPNISPWRRAVFGDLTSCFDFKNPNKTRPTLFPAPTKAQADAVYAQQSGAADTPMPALGTGPLPTQNLLIRPSRALPYRLDVAATVDPVQGQVVLSFDNLGTQGAVFHVYDELNLARYPRRYTVEAGRSLQASWSAGVGTAGKYRLWVLGPNGFHRRFRGNISPVGAGRLPEIRTTYLPDINSIRLTFRNHGSQSAAMTVTSKAYGSVNKLWNLRVEPNQQSSGTWWLTPSYGWYDLTLAMGSDFERTLAGRIETGKDGFSDPTMGVPAGNS